MIQYDELLIQQNKSSSKEICNFNEVFQNITARMIMMIEKKMNTYQAMAIIIFIMQYFLTIIKIERSTLNPTAKYYLKQTVYNDLFYFESVKPFDSAIIHFTTYYCPGTNFYDKNNSYNDDEDEFDLEDIKNIAINVYKMSFCEVINASSLLYPFHLNLWHDVHRVI